MEGNIACSNVLDEFTHESLAIRVARKLKAIDVIDVLSDLFIVRGMPGHIRSDNGSEFVAKAVRDWIAAGGAKTAYIAPGSPCSRCPPVFSSGNCMIGCAVSRDVGSCVRWHRNDAISPSTLSAFCWSTAIQISLICVLTGAVTAGDRFMPRMFLDDLNYTPVLHYATGTIVLLSVVALLLMRPRLTSVLDLWVIFAICMLITEKTLVTLGMTTRFSLGWYVSRAFVVAVSIAVLIALLSKLMRLHATLLRSQHQQRTLNAELDHRVKNVLATVSAIIAQTPKSHSTQADYAAGLDQRIRSLARTHELLSGGQWDGVSLADIVCRELAPYATDNAEIGGPDVTLRAEAAQAMGMVLHELATNAAKYGAFSKPGGRLLLQWRWLQNGSRGRLAIEWQELGGPLVVKPNHFGYGASTIRELIPFELGGTVDLAFASSGLQCQLEIPTDWVRGTLGHAALHEGAS